MGEERHSPVFFTPYWGSLCRFDDRLDARYDCRKFPHRPLMTGVGLTDETLRFVCGGLDVTLHVHLIFMSVVCVANFGCRTYTLSQMSVLLIGIRHLPVHRLCWYTCSLKCWCKRICLS